MATGNGLLRDRRGTLSARSQPWQLAGKRATGNDSDTARNRRVSAPLASVSTGAPWIVFSVEDRDANANADTLAMMRLRVVALVAILALMSGCFGYNRSAKRWAYVGNTVLIVGGGAAIAGDVLLAKDPDPGMTMTAADEYDPPLSGVMLAGIVLATAGLIGMIINATRPTVKTSR